MTRRLVVVSVPNDKRTGALGAATARAGLPAPFWVPWSDVLREPACVGAKGRPGDLLRVESPGADAATWHALAQMGGFPGQVEGGEWRPGRAWFYGLERTLHSIEASARHLTPTHPAKHVVAMTDKLICHERLIAAGVPAPPAFQAHDGAPAMRMQMRAAGWNAVYVKPRWGSSGAGVLAFRSSGTREQVITTASLRDGKLYNDKRLHAYDDRESIDVLLSAILTDGAVVQRWIPKATATGGPFDLRVLVVSGAIAQRVARIGRGTITNLHAGAARANADDVLGVFGGATRARVYDACLRAAECFPGYSSVGVDVMIDTRGRPFVLECNAWGDYLPRLLVDGCDSYDLQLHALFREAA